MAKSPSHKFGQIIGDVLEAAIEPPLLDFAREHKLYLDKKGPRPARRGKKVSWIDLYDNAHDLDYVLERGGDPQRIGTPVAFIETAWRRYTKHSRNKAQEIQGAILPLVTTHQNAAPFIGVILAGVFTEGALTQLKSLGFTVLYFPYETILKAFAAVGIDASSDESTPDAQFAQKVQLWEALSTNQRSQVYEALLKANSKEVEQFMENLKRAVTRQIKSIRVLPLHGSALSWASVEEAIEFIEHYDETDSEKPVVKYEIQIHYSNGDRIEGQFKDKQSAVDFLRSYQRPTLKPSL